VFFCPFFPTCRPPCPPPTPLVPSQVDTTNILFIAGGAFVGLDAAVAERTASASIGFGAPVRARARAAGPPPSGATRTPADDAAAAERAAALAGVEHSDLVSYGLIPEFVGRFPVVAALRELGAADLAHVLTVPQSCLKAQYTVLLAAAGARLALAPSAVAAIAAQAADRGTGARGLRATMERVLRDAMFAAPDAVKGGGFAGVLVDAGGDKGAPRARLFSDRGEWAAALAEVGEVDPAAGDEAADEGGAPLAAAVGG